MGVRYHERPHSFSGTMSGAPAAPPVRHGIDNRLRLRRRADRTGVPAETPVPRRTSGATCWSACARGKLTPTSAPEPERVARVVRVAVLRSSSERDGARRAGVALLSRYIASNRGSFSCLRSGSPQRGDAILLKRVLRRARCRIGTPRLPSESRATSRAHPVLGQGRQDRPGDPRRHRARRFAALDRDQRARGGANQRGRAAPPGALARIAIGRRSPVGARPIYLGDRTTRSRSRRLSRPSAAWKICLDPRAHCRPLPGARENIRVRRDRSLDRARRRVERRRARAGRITPASSG